MRYGVKLGVLFLASLSFIAFAQNKTRVLKVHYTDPSQEGMEVNLSLPLSMVRDLQPQIQQVLGEMELEQNGINLPQIWAAIKAAEPNDFVEVQSNDVNLQVSTTETHFIVKVRSEKEGDIDVKLPLALGDAMFTENLQVDVDALLLTLEGLAGQDLVTVTGPKANARVWIE